ncbi:hypothetical protein B0H21DRAFT_689338 [Amylocystis lapponica]|nr:hypothetical protein B0H21DRAFT_689338 [Amylocystis lapponica]
MDFDNSERTDDRTDFSPDGIVQARDPLVGNALSAPSDLFQINSRLGAMPAYNTVYSALERLADQEASIVAAHGRDPESTGMIWFDNVQNYLLQRDVRVGQENKLNIGIAATYVEIPRAIKSAFSLEDKRRRVAENRREKLSVEDLFGMVDESHCETVGMLQWLRTLTHYIPQLASYKEAVSSLYRSDGAKQQVPVQPARVHPLATSGKNETVTTELKDAVLDFYAQTGQKPGSSNYKPQLTLFGGDGLTFDQLNLLKLYLQFHDDPFESFELVEPVLAPWHTAWTDLSHLIETHWGTPLSHDPSTLGHSATKISQRTPSNLKKVDYNSGAEMMYIVLDVRMLDCWRLHFKTTDLFTYFTELSTKNALPSFADLEVAARRLYRSYSTVRGAERACYSVEDPEPPAQRSTWANTVLLGSPWDAAAVEKTSLMNTENNTSLGSFNSDSHTPSAHVSGSDTVQRTDTLRSTTSDEPTNHPAPAIATAHHGSNTPAAAPKPFTGDYVLAHSIVFIRDATISREFTLAMAEGDVGRMCEALKVMLFTFAGSSHSKYTSYLLETVCSLELESSPELRETILSQLVVNLSGQPGHFTGGDLMQEHFNWLLQAIAERKGTEYSAHFVRNIVSRNLHHMSRLQNEIKSSIGLERRAGRHSDPHTKSEIKILSREYREHELHSRRPGRTYDLDVRDVDDYRRGVTNLRSGKLDKWIKETTFMRSVHVRANGPPSRQSPITAEVHGPSAVDRVPSDGNDACRDSDSDDDEQDIHSSVQLTSLPSIHLVDGELIIQDTDIDAEASGMLAQLDNADQDSSDDEGFPDSDSEVGKC